MSPQPPSAEPTSPVCAEVRQQALILAGSILAGSDENEVLTREHDDWVSHNSHLVSHLASCARCASLVEESRELLVDLPAALDHAGASQLSESPMPASFEHLAGFQKPEPAVELELRKLFADSHVKAPRSLDARVFAALDKLPSGAAGKLTSSAAAVASPRPLVMRVRATATLAAACLLGILFLFAEGIIGPSRSIGPSNDPEVLLVVEAVDAPFDTSRDFNAFVVSLVDPKVKPTGLPWSKRRGR